jgi:hypothetical protein
MLPDRQTFMETVTLLNPFELTDGDAQAIAHSIGRGRARVQALAKTPSAWDAAADTVRMDGWRRNAGRWTLEHDVEKTPSFFSLLDLFYLGGPPVDIPLDRWGIAAGSIEGCICTRAPVPGLAFIVAGRPQVGVLATQVVDLNFRIVERLVALHLPAALAPGVLAAAVQDYIEQVKPLHSSDWLTLVRMAQDVTDERIEDYVASLTADGPLVADLPTLEEHGMHR